jgi:serine/threonine protein kinase
MQRNVAQQLHAANAFIALKIIPEHKDYSFLQFNHDDLSLYNDLLLRIHVQQEKFNGVSTLILPGDTGLEVDRGLDNSLPVAIEQVLEKDYDLPDQIESLPKRERELLSQRTWGTFRCEHPSCWDKIDKFRFNVFEDLAHHYKVAHPAIILPESFPCNYSACKRSEDPFTRKDAYRDHLREYHMEDMLKRHKNQKREQEWLASRDISPDWWRCSRCLARINVVKKEGWTCRDCGRECEPIRVTIRTTAVRRRYTTPERENINALNLLPPQKKNTSEDQTALQEGQPSTGNGLTESLETIKAFQKDTETPTDSKKTLVINASLGFQFLDFGYSHSEYQNHKVVPFITIKQLGHGSLGSVDAVRRSGEGEGPLFARKVIRLPNMARKRLLPLIQQEVAVLRELRHRHIVQVVSTYETTSVPRQFGIILHPAGDEDLSHYLDRIGEDDFPEEDVKRLWKWQYCLASAVAYIHAQNIRHKDIKPSNAICKGDEIFLTDFGSAHQFSAGLTSSTEGYAVGITKMYSAPEVISLDRRGRPADIYSLGCVFAEMVTVAGHRRIEDFHDFRSEPIPDEPDRMTLCYYATAHKLVDWFGTDESPWAYSLLVRMLEDDQKLRPSAEEVLLILAEHTPSSDCSCRPRTASNPKAQEIEANGGSEANGAQTQDDGVVNEEEQLIPNIDQGLLQWPKITSMEIVSFATARKEIQEAWRNVV